MTEPFAPGSVALGLYSHDLPIGPRLDALLGHAVAAADAGFDGVTVPEHHGASSGYVPNPIQLAGWLLDAMPRGFAAPFPVLLPLRPTGLVIEELAWLAARFPGRVGAGFGSGYVVDDFEVVGADFAGRSGRFRAALAEIAAANGGRVGGVLGDDAAVRALAGAPIPLIGAVKGPKAIETVARLGFGICLPSADDAEGRSLHGAYQAAGGAGPRIVGRWVWVGPTPPEVPAFAAPAGRSDRSWGQAATAPPLVFDADPLALAERLHASAVAAAGTALSVRFRFPASAPEVVREQIVRFGAEVLPRLRELLGGETR